MDIFSQRFDVQTLASDSKLASLDQNLQHVICSLASQKTSFCDLLRSEAEQTREQLTSAVTRLERMHFEDRAQREEDKWYDELTRSLFYPEITSRQEQIEETFDGIKDSYDWIFGEPLLDNGVPKWTDFSQWLKSGDNVYWVNGKAGSGKSTLMNRICNHPRTKKFLQQWADGKQLLTPTHFFWNAGNRQQKTIDGLLRSLAYQILTECRQLAVSVQVSR